MITRRQFIARSSALSCVALGGTVPMLFAQAAQNAKKQDANDNVLVVVELAGGNDGLNTVIPFANDLYYKNRKTLGVPKDQILKINDSVGFHPSLSGINELLKAGKLAVVQGVGYPQPDRSHFRSMEIWHTASTSSKIPTTGWMGRVLDARFPNDQKEHLRALAMTGSLPQAFQSDTWSVPVIQQIDNFANISDQNSARDKALRKLANKAADNNATLDFLKHQTEAVFKTAEKLREAASKYTSTVNYGYSDLSNQLRRCAQIIAADSGVRLLYTAQGGYDTHSEQQYSHATLLTELSTAISAFQQDMDQMKMADKVTLMVFSEFGRRVDENASQGTDHGAASCMFLVGNKVKPGLSGEYPSLEKLGDGDLVHTVDFRTVYASLLDKWLGCPSEKLLGEKFAPAEVMA